MSAPSSRISPMSGRSNPAIMRSNVVLPQPEGPSRVKNSPASTARLTLSTAVSGPKRRVTLRISRSAMPTVLSELADGEKNQRRGKYHEERRHKIVAARVLLREALESGAELAEPVLGERA